MFSPNLTSCEVQERNELASFVDLGVGQKNLAMHQRSANRSPRVMEDTVATVWRCVPSINVAKLSSRTNPECSTMAKLPKHQLA